MITVQLIIQFSVMVANIFISVINLDRNHGLCHVVLFLLVVSCIGVIPRQFNKCFPRTPSDCFEIWHGCRTWLENNVCGFLVK